MAAQAARDPAVPNVSTLGAQAFAFGVIGFLLLSLLTIVATSLLQGIVVAEVARGTLGERLTLRQLLGYLRGRFAALMGWGLLLAGGIGLLMAVAVLTLLLFGGGIAAMGVGEVGTTVAVIAVILVGVPAGIVLVIWLWTKTVFVAPTIVLERQPVFASIARSWRLTRGRFWRTFGILLLVLLIINVASQVVATPVSLAAGLVIGLLAPQGLDDTGGIALSVVVYLVTFLVTTIVAAIGLVIQSATASLLYVDARMRSEGLDLELARFVEMRSAGAALDDPYLPRAST